MHLSQVSCSQALGLLSINYSKLGSKPIMVTILDATSNLVEDSLRMLDRWREDCKRSKTNNPSMGAS